MQEMIGMLQKIASARGGGLWADLFALAALGFAAFTYVFMVWERHQGDSALREDGQLGLKIVLYALLIASVGIAAGGVGAVLAFLLAGASDSFLIKAGLGSLIAGGGSFALVLLFLLPRTNAAVFPTVERLALGYVALVASMVVLLSLNAFLVGLFTSAPWRLATSRAFANLFAFGALAAYALWRFGTISGWAAAVRHAASAPGEGAPYAPTAPPGSEQPAPGASSRGAQPRRKT